MSESSGPGEVSAPSRESGAQGPACDGSALPDLGELRRLAEAATPGPWTHDATPARRTDHHDFDSEMGTIVAGDVYVLEYAGCGSHAIAIGKDDADYIAAAHPQAVLALLNRHESALGRLRVLETGHTAELTALRETNQRLNRRCQQAEAAAARSADSVKAELYGRRKGKPLGRMLANIRLTELEAAADALAEAAGEVATNTWRENIESGERELAAALAAYRAVRSNEGA